MEKKTIGAFIAALRKSNGMTQQELADRLNISNKAISRWERDECAPDLSLIPVLAEIFNVTCDELLKGERILTDSKHDKSKPKVEKQLKTLINRVLSTFKTMIWISWTLSFVGLVCMFGISYGFYRPIIGFSVMLLFEATAFAFAVIGLNRARDIKTNNELCEEIGETLSIRFNKTLGSYSYFAFFAIVATILSSLPLVLLQSDYIDSILSINSYFAIFFSGIVLLLVFLFLVFRFPYMEWASTGIFPRKMKNNDYRNAKKMNCIQIILIVTATLLFLILPYLITGPNDYMIYDIALYVPVGCLLANIIIGIIFFVRHRNERKLLSLPCIRNILMVFPALLFNMAHHVSWGFTNGILSDRYDNWNTGIILVGLWIALIIYLIFGIIEKVKRK